VSPTGRLGIAAVFLHRDARPRRELQAHRDLAIPWAELFRKDISIEMERDRDERYNEQLRDLIIAGLVKPSIVVSHRLTLADAPIPSAASIVARTAASKSSSTCGC
jgi:glutathione-independent formaldehyde dehydrogenase